MILLIGGVKGGVGKTTTAINLALQRAANGYSVLLVDADAQASATLFADLREDKKKELPYTNISLQDQQIFVQVPKLAKNYDDIIIDAPGKDSQGQRYALAIADRFLTPIAPKYFDIATLDQVSKIVSMAQANNPNLKWLLFVNLAYPKNKDNEEVATFINEIENVTLLPKRVTNRKAFSDAIAEGLAITELKKTNSKAINELNELYQQIW